MCHSCQGSTVILSNLNHLQQLSCWTRERKMGTTNSRYTSQILANATFVSKSYIVWLLFVFHSLPTDHVQCQQLFIIYSCNELLLINCYLLVFHLGTSMYSCCEQVGWMCGYSFHSCNKQTMWEACPHYYCRRLCWIYQTQVGQETFFRFFFIWVG